VSKSIQLKKDKPITKLISENQQEIKNNTASCELSSFNQKTHSVATSWARRTICHCELSEAIPYLGCRRIYSEPFGFAQGKLRRRTPIKRFPCCHGIAWKSILLAIMDCQVKNKMIHQELIEEAKRRF